MLLRDFLTAHRLTYENFARVLGVSNARTVQRYASGERIPRPAVMARIREATGGVVTASDFYDLVPAIVGAREAEGGCHE